MFFSILFFFLLKKRVTLEDGDCAMGKRDRNRGREKRSPYTKGIMFISMTCILACRALRLGGRVFGEFLGDAGGGFFFGGVDGHDDADDG